MTKERYFQIRQSLPLDRHLWVTTTVLAADAAALLWLSRWLPLGYGSPAFWAAQLLLAVIYFHHFAILHEAGHGNVDARDGWNALAGHYASLFCFLPYYPWKYIHHEHHTWTGNLERDPTLRQLRRMKQAGHVPWSVRLAWRSWIPAGALLQHTVFWLYPLRAWREGRLRGAQGRRSLFSVVFLACGYGLLAYAGPAWLTWANLWPSLAIYLVAVELVNFPHHIDMPVLEDPEAKLAPWQQQATTRSCDYGIWSAVLVLNFNLHTEHHLYPKVPWYRLKTVRDRIRPDLPDYVEEKGIAWNLRNRAVAARDMILRRRVIPAVKPRRRDAA